MAGEEKPPQILKEYLIGILSEGQCLPLIKSTKVFYISLFIEYVNSQARELNWLFLPIC
jgi:hypothetical protein